MTKGNRVVTKRRLVECQMYWKDWYIPFAKVDFEADEYGPREQVICVGPLQMRFELWSVLQ